MVLKEIPEVKKNLIDTIKLKIASIILDRRIYASLILHILCASKYSLHDDKKFAMVIKACMLIPFLW